MNGQAKPGGRLPQKGREASDLADVRKREHDAVQLALAGATYQQIADQLGFSSRGNAWRTVQRVLARVDAEDAAALRTVEGGRLDRMQTAVWANAVKGDVKAVGAVLRIMERRARLFGLDAPIQVDARISDATDAQIAELAEQLGMAKGPTEIPTE
jgi:hypothetical protein